MSNDDKPIPSNADTQGQPADVSDVLADMSRSLEGSPDEQGVSAVPESFDDVFGSEPSGPDTGWPEDEADTTVPPAFAAGAEASEAGGRIDIDLPDADAGEPTDEPPFGHDPAYDEEDNGEASGSVIGEDFPPAVHEAELAGDAVDGAGVTQALSNWVSGAGPSADPDDEAEEGPDTELAEHEAMAVSASSEEDDDDVPLVMAGGVDQGEETLTEEDAAAGGIPMWAKALVGTVGLGIVGMFIYLGSSLLSGGASDTPAPQARRAPVHRHQAAPSAGSASRAASHPADSLKATAPSTDSPAVAGEEGASHGSGASPTAPAPRAAAHQPPLWVNSAQGEGVHNSQGHSAPSSSSAGPPASGAADVTSPPAAPMADDVGMPNLSGVPSGLPVGAVAGAPGATSATGAAKPAASTQAQDGRAQPAQIQRLIDSAVAKRTQTLEQRLKKLSAQLTHVEAAVSSSAKASKASAVKNSPLNAKTIAELRQLLAQRHRHHKKTPTQKVAHHHRLHQRTHHHTDARRHYSLVGAVSGRAVLQHEGKTVTVSVGDTLAGYGRISRIGADGCVYAHKGVIRTPSATCPRED